ncbi:MAG TPA: hypothetical protein VKM69_09290 [Natronoarchaeum rubrum]|nr:hypothetical protein [Natronoarchaeum rubrum]
MPSRRTLLRSASVAGVGALAGCNALRPGAEGYVQLKTVEGMYGENGVWKSDTVIDVELSSPPGEKPPELEGPFGEWDRYFDTPRQPVVSESLHEELRLSYEKVRYVVGVCTPKWADGSDDIGCYNVATTRETFNAAQVHDRVRASSDGSSMTIHSTDGEWSFDSE